MVFIFKFCNQEILIQPLHQENFENIIKMKFDFIKEKLLEGSIYSGAFFIHVLKINEVTGQEKNRIWYITLKTLKNCAFLVPVTLERRFYLLLLLFF